MLDSSVNYFWTNKSNAFDVEMENNICHLLVSDMPRLGKQIEKTCLDNQCDIGTWRLLKRQNILHEGCCLWVRGIGRSEFQIWTSVVTFGSIELWSTTETLHPFPGLLKNSIEKRLARFRVLCRWLNYSSFSVDWDGNGVKVLLTTFVCLFQLYLGHLKNVPLESVLVVSFHLDAKSLIVPYVEQKGSQFICFRLNLITITTFVTNKPFEVPPRDTYLPHSTIIKT